nr:unnamed protein product [Digitaria exilis]
MAELGSTKELEVETGAPVPSLLSLCLDAAAARLTRDCAGVGTGGAGWPGGFVEEGGGEADEDHLGPEQVAEALPWELLHRLASRLPPAALELLHHAAQARCCYPSDTTAGLGEQDDDRRGMKRSRCEDFNTAWQSLFKLRWPHNFNTGHDSMVTVNWQQQYWERHLQECLDEATESALLPSFCGSIGDLSVSAKIMNSIYRSEDISQQHSRLTCQLRRFGCYARCLRLQGVLCTTETYDLLQYCKLERLMFIRIISEPEISGWLSKVNKSSTSLSTLKSDISLNSLSVLNLRGNNLQDDDVVDLHKILFKMPNLRDLDISCNPIMDEGISIGVGTLLECLTSAKQPLDMLSIADNSLGSRVAPALAKFLGSHVRDLNVEDIDLGTLGFQILEEALPMEVALSHINISKNRGGIRAAYFVSRLILRGPNLISVNAAANILPSESLEVICNTLKQRTGNLERVDLSGNIHLSGAISPAFLEFKKHGKSILVIQSNFRTYVPYDDDP